MSTSVETPPLSEQTIQFLTQEMDKFLQLYVGAQASAHSVFNAYLTFVTTVVGALIFILQIAPQVNIATTPLTVGGLLLFSAIVGSVYLSALSGRYAHAGRYARAVDAIRYHLIQHQHIATPPLYSAFLSEHQAIRSAKSPWYVMLFPSGSYQMFIALINSAALAGFTWLVFSVAGAESTRQVWATLIVFLLTSTLYNIYTNLTLIRFHSRLHVSIDISETLPLWAGRQ